MSNNSSIHKFVDYFNLLKPDGVTGFAAKVVFNKDNIEKERYTEVQILLGDHLNAIYLINPDLPFEDLPDTFMDKASQYVFKGDHLKVLSKEDKNFTVDIYPVVID